MLLTELTIRVSFHLLSEKTVFVSSNCDDSDFSMIEAMALYTEANPPTKTVAITE